MNTTMTTHSIIQYSINLHISRVNILALNFIRSKNMDDYIISFGKYKGNTFKWVADNHLGYCYWVARLGRKFRAQNDFKKYCYKLINELRKGRINNNNNRVRIPIQRNTSNSPPSPPSPPLPLSSPSTDSTNNEHKNDVAKTEDSVNDSETVEQDDNNDLPKDIEITQNDINADDLDDDLECEITPTRRLIYHSGCYLIQLHSDYLLGNNRYKVGRSKNLLSRLKAKEYTNAHIISVRGCDDSVRCEKELLATFRTCFKPIVQSSTGTYGDEYFEGDIVDMIAIFEIICNKYFKK